MLPLIHGHARVDGNINRLGTWASTPIAPSLSLPPLAVNFQGMRTPRPPTHPTYTVPDAKGVQLPAF